MEVYKKLIKDLTWFACVYLLLKLWYPILPFWKDSTDPPYSRSGMTLRIDHETGLHYLESGRGCLIPRLDKEGNQVRE